MTKKPKKLETESKRARFEKIEICENVHKIQFESNNLGLVWNLGNLPAEWGKMPGNLIHIPTSNSEWKTVEELLEDFGDELPDEYYLVDVGAKPQTRASKRFAVPSAWVYGSSIRRRVANLFHNQVPSWSARLGGLRSGVLLHTDSFGNVHGFLRVYHGTKRFVFLLIPLFFDFSFFCCLFCFLFYVVFGGQFF